MNLPLKYPVWRKHPELRALLSVLASLTATIAEATRDVRIPKCHVEMLRELRQKLVEKLRDELYARTPLRKGDVLFLDVETLEPTINVLASAAELEALDSALAEDEELLEHPTQERVRAVSPTV